MPRQATRTPTPRAARRAAQGRQRPRRHPGRRERGHRPARGARRGRRAAALKKWQLQIEGGRIVGPGDAGPARQAAAGARGRPRHRYKTKADARPRRGPRPRRREFIPEQRRAQGDAAPARHRRGRACAALRDGVPSARDFEPATPSRGFVSSAATTTRTRRRPSSAARRGAAWPAVAALRLRGLLRRHRRERLAHGPRPRGGAGPGELRDRPPRRCAPCARVRGGDPRGTASTGGRCAWDAAPGACWPATQLLSQRAARHEPAAQDITPDTLPPTGVVVGDDAVGPTTSRPLIHRFLTCWFLVVSAGGGRGAARLQGARASRRRRRVRAVSTR